MSDITVGQQRIDTSKRTWLIASGCAGAVGAGVASPSRSSAASSLRSAPRRPARRSKSTSAASSRARRSPSNGAASRSGSCGARPRSSPSCPSSTASSPTRKSKRNPDELTPEYARNEDRSIKPEVLVVVGICTHLGCSPIDKFQPGAAAFAARRLGRRLPLPLPRLDLRPGRPRLQEQARARQPRGAAAHVPVRHAPADRRRQEGLSRNERTWLNSRKSPPNAPRRREAAQLGRQPLPADQALERARGASTTRRRTSTSGTSSARSRCWCW